VKVVICDDHRLFADALAVVLRREGIDVCEIVTSPVEAADAVMRQGPAVCVMDVTFPASGICGIEGTRRIRSAAPDTAVLVLTSRTDRETAVAALAAGAGGIVYKVQPVGEIVRAVVRLAAGEFVIDPVFVRQSLVAEAPRRRGAPVLTPREHDVLAMLADGFGTAAIAERLQIGTATVRGHVQAILMKLDAHSRIEAVAVAVRCDMLRKPDGDSEDPATEPVPEI
jgi:two-component system nitrate/nitrite response regulator NarL